ncbi:claudin-4-like [Betta splendens]|uniref:Claudin n=1 Tax=Betta splendens TaxID=158456 RepID=A0A6P7PKA7_BETSP|nr:claudin-4-like [Betta splendens]
MASAGKQTLAVALAVLGFVGSIIVCGLPMWTVSAFVGANIVTSQTTWEGLWMNCVTQSTGQMQCKIYDSFLALPAELQAARAFSVAAVIAGLLGVVLAVAGAKCTTFIGDETQKCRAAIAAGAVLLVSGLLVLVPVCWTATAVVRNFYSGATADAQRRELGPALYVGWGVAVGLVLSGGLLCTSCPRGDDDHYDVEYAKARSVGASGDSV